MCAVALAKEYGATKVTLGVVLIKMMGTSAWCPSAMIAGAFDQQVFDLWVEQMLVPQLHQGDWVLLDNVSFHYSAHALQLIEAVGATALHIPAYSPDFNPIKECFSKFKEYLRSAKARTKRKLYLALAKAIEKVTTAAILGWFKHCGYVYSLN